MNSSDALFVLQYDVGLRSGRDTLPLLPETLFLPACDVNDDTKCNAIDALQILQCDVGIENAFCEEQ
ncbi:hypothetical protein KFU94_18660 [Chloroflexi bacterium TSY]|nr:hypothetical protein [Chloroflexi bacterium TSY]